MAKGSEFYTVMVVGDEPQELLKDYGTNVVLEPYIKYYYKDAKKLKNKSLKVISDMLDNAENIGMTPIMIDFLKDRYNNINGMSDFEYYSTMTDGLSYDEEGNAMTTENPNAKWKTFNVGKNFCIPFTLKDGTQAYSAKSKDINWEAMRFANKELYAKVWKLYHKEIEPETFQDKEIYNNIKNQKKYFENFKNIDEYVNYSCSYWTYAYLDKNGWVDAEDKKNYEWITGFYDRFVTHLNDEDTVTIYECTKP